MTQDARSTAADYLARMVAERIRPTRLLRKGDVATDSSQQLAFQLVGPGTDPQLGVALNDVVTVEDIEQVMRLPGWVQAMADTFNDLAAYRAIEADLASPGL